MPDPPDEFLTVAEVAAILKLNQQTVRNWIKCGIPALIHNQDFRIIPIGHMANASRPEAVAVRVRIIEAL